MLFTDPIFLFYFFPASLILHRLFLGKSGAPYPSRMCLYSFFLTLIFYGYREPWWLLPFFICVILDFFWGFLLGMQLSPRARASICSLSIIQNVMLLAVFKYRDLLAGILSDFGLPAFFPVIDLKGAKNFFPAGISFYTLESLSFVIDIYRRKVYPPKNPLRFLGFISMYPRFIAGPIVRYNQMVDQFNSYRGMDIENGLTIFFVGFSLKVLFANSFSIFTKYAFGHSNHVSFLSAWTGVISYTFEVYFDVWSYSLMAIGIGRCFGFLFPQNFDKPYYSLSVKDFWRRWHMSLSSWIRDYIYIPIGGKHDRKIVTGIHLFLTMIVSGIWHGASWNCLLWGAWHGLGLMLENLVPGLNRLPNFLRWSYTFLFVSSGLALFRTKDPAEFFRILQSMLGPFSTGMEFRVEGFFANPINAFLCFVALLYFILIEPKISMRAFESQQTFSVGLRVFFATVFVFALFLNFSSEAVPFIYFQF